jgi:hypothetical protein
MTIGTFHLPQRQYHTAVLARPNNLSHPLRPFFVKPTHALFQGIGDALSRTQPVELSLLAGGLTCINQIFGTPAS